MNLVIDIGNTRVKYAVMRKGGGDILYLTASESFDMDCVEAIMHDFPQIDRSIVSSTRGPADHLIAPLQQRIGHCLLFNIDVEVPIENRYLSPQTLGRDRLAAAVGAVSEYPDRAILIVDMGSAITVDFVEADGAYCGGVISAGVSMRFRALNEFTASLPLCEIGEQVDDLGEILLGETTRSAIVRGIFNSVLFELEGYISHFVEKNEKLFIIFTGGDAKYFVKRIKNTIFANQNLVLHGLNVILEHNANKKSYS